MYTPGEQLAASPGIDHEAETNLAAYSPWSTGFWQSGRRQDGESDLVRARATLPREERCHHRPSIAECIDSFGSLAHSSLHLAPGLPFDTKANASGRYHLPSSPAEPHLASRAVGIDGRNLAGWVQSGNVQAKTSAPKIWPITAAPPCSFPSDPIAFYI